MTTFLFIGGAARSGTSALCEMLNHHSKIALGMERYKNIASSGELFNRGKEAFEKDRFFDYHASETNIPLDGGKYGSLYAKLREKFDQTTVRGDKVPSYYKHMEEIIATFPRVKVLMIWRDVDEVAMSWGRRSRDSSSWPAKNDASAAIIEWKRAMSMILDGIDRYPAEILCVRYSDVFSKQNLSPVKIIKWLGLDMEDEYRNAVISIRAKAQEISKNREPVSEEVRNLIIDDELVEINAAMTSASLR